MTARREVYADHAATTRPAPEVLAAMRPFFEDGFGNASSVHVRGEAARDEHAGGGEATRDEDAGGGEAAR